MTSSPSTSTRPSPTRLAIGLGALLLIPGLLLLDTLIAMARGWDIPDNNTRPTVGVFVALAVIPALLMLLRPARRTIARNAPQIATLVIVTLLMLLLVNWILARRQRIEGKPPHSHLHAVNLHREYNPSSEIMPGISGKAVFQCNSQGVRGGEMPPRDKGYRILCVGGSTTECLYLDQSETWTLRLADEIRKLTPDKPTWSGSAGLSGASTVHHLPFIRDAEVVGQVDCVVLLAGINELERTLRQGEAAPGAGRRTRARKAAAQKKEEENITKAPLWYNLSLFRVIRSISDEDDNVMAEDVLGQRYQLRRKLRNEGKKIDQLPDLTASLKEYGDRLREAADVCKNRNVRLVLVTQPVAWSNNTPPEIEKLFWFGMYGKEGYITTPRLREGMDRFNQVARDVAAEKGIEIVNLDSMNGNPAYFCDDCHFSEAGAAEVARLVAKHFSLSHK